MRFAAARGDGQVKNMKDYIELPIEIDARDWNVDFFKSNTRSGIL